MEGHLAKTPKKKNIERTSVYFEEFEPEPSKFTDQAMDSVGRVINSIYSQLSTKTPSPDLELVQTENRFRFLPQSLGVVLVSAIVGPIVGIMLGEGNFNGSIFSHWNIENLPSDIDVFLFFALGLPTIIVGLIFSAILFAVSTNYILIFRKELVTTGGNLINSIRFTIGGLQFISVLIFILGSRWWLFVSMAVLFAGASVLVRRFSRSLTRNAKTLHKKIDRSNFEFRKFRLGFIIKHKIFAQIQKGWGVLNILFFLFFLFVASQDIYFRYFLSSIPLTNGELFSVRLYWVIFATILISSLMGSFRTYSEYLRSKYLRCAAILNKEYAILKGNDDGAEEEGKLGGEIFYTIEDDKSVAPFMKSERSNFAKGLQPIGALLASSRFLGSSAFAAIVFALSRDIGFSILALLVLLFSYLLNDIVDFKSGKDLIVHPNRPLPSGRLSTNTAGLALLILIGAIILLLALSVTEKWESIVVLSLVGTIYSLVLKNRAPIIATPFWCAGIAFLLSSTISESLGLFLSLWALILGREIILEFRDSELDHQFNLSKNLGFIFGQLSWAACAVCFSIGAFGVYLLGWQSLAINIFLVGALIIAFSIIVERCFDKTSAVKAFSVITHFAWPIALIYV